MALSGSETELIQVRTSIECIEGDVKTQFKIFEKRQEIPPAMNEDYSQRGFSLHVYFDQINLAQIDKIMVMVKDLLIQHRALRKREAVLAQVIREEKAMENLLAGGYKSHA